MLKRLILLLLVVLVFVSIITGCGKKEGEKTEPTAVPEDKATPVATEAPKEIVTHDLVYTMWGYQDQFQSDKKPKYWDLVAEEINKKLEVDKGFKVNFTPLAFPAEGLGEKINLELAAGTSIDLIKFTGDIFTMYVNKNAATDIKPLLDKYGPNILAKYPQNVWDEFTKDGKIYAIPQVDFPYPVASWVRADWVTKAGLQMPATLAEFESLLKAFKENDLDENGKNDTVPLIASVDYLIDYLNGAYTDHPGDYVEGDIVKSRIEDPGYKEVLMTLQRWYKEKYIDDTIFDVASGNIAADLFSKDKLGMEIATVWEIEWGALNAVYKARTDASFKFLPVVSDVKSYPATNGISGGYIFVPTTSKNPEIAIQYMDWLFASEENYVLNQPGLGILDKTFILGENSAPDLPQAEVDAGVKAGELLSGPYSNLMIVQHNLKYLPAATPPETRIAYDWVMNLDLTKLYVPVTKTLGVTLPEDLKVKFTDTETIKKEYIQKIITGKATYEEMIEKWKAAGGDKIFAEYTAAYKAIH